MKKIKTQYATGIRQNYHTTTTNILRYKISTYNSDKMYNIEDTETVVFTLPELESDGCRQRI